MSEELVPVESSFLFPETEAEVTVKRNGKAIPPRALPPGQRDRLHVARMENQAAPFPVEWDTPEEAQAMWILDEAHNLRQMRLLDFELRMAPMTEGTNTTFTLYGAPFKVAPKLINSFVYQNGVPKVPAEEVGGAMKAVDAAIRRGCLVG